MYFSNKRKPPKSLDFNPSHELLLEQKLIGESKLESTPKIQLNETVYLECENYTFKKPWDSIKWKQKGVKSPNKNPMKDYRNCSGKKEIKWGVNCCFGSGMHEIPLVKQPNRALYLLGDQRCSIKKKLKCTVGSREYDYNLNNLKC